jgi:hypothetical protein
VTGRSPDVAQREDLRLDRGGLADLEGRLAGLAALVGLAGLERQAIDPPNRG